MDSLWKQKGWRRNSITENRSTLPTIVQENCGRPSPLTMAFTFPSLKPVVLSFVAMARHFPLGWFSSGNSFSWRKKKKSLGITVLPKESKTKYFPTAGSGRLSFCFSSFSPFSGLLTKKFHFGYLRDELLWKRLLMRKKDPFACFFCSNSVLEHFGTTFPPSNYIFMVK